MARGVARHDGGEPRDSGPPLAYSSPEPLGQTTFSPAFRRDHGQVRREGTILPARAGESYDHIFWRCQARQAHPSSAGRITATGAFATIILERLLDVVTVLALLASYVFVFGRELGGTNPVAFARLEVDWRERRSHVAFGALAVLFVLAGDQPNVHPPPERSRACCASTLRRSSRALRRKFASGLSGFRRQAACSWRSCGLFHCGCRSPSAFGAVAR